MAKLLKSRPNVLEEPFTNIAFQYFLPVPDRSIHELLVVCSSAMLLEESSNFVLSKSVKISFFPHFYFLHYWCLAVGLLPVDEMYIGETGNCGRQNCNLGNALPIGWPEHYWAFQCIVYITALGAGHCTRHCTGHSNCTVYCILHCTSLRWALGARHFNCTALGGSAIKIN